jgi:hypothetical protein
MKPLADGSIRFQLQGGKYHGIVVRLYPDRDSWSNFVYDGETYTHPAHQNRSKPFLVAV